MTHPLTEKIVEAIKQAAIIMEEPANPSKEGTIIDLPVKVLRTAIQSVIDGVGRPKATEQNVREFFHGYFFFFDQAERDKIADGIIRFLKDYNVLNVLPEGYDLSQLKEGRV